MDLSTLFGDAVALWSTLAVICTLAIGVVVIIRVIKLMNTTHSED